MARIASGGAAVIFERPEFLGWIPGAIGIATLVVILQWRRSVALVRGYGGPVPAERLLGQRLDRFPWLRAVTVAGVVATVLAAAAGPTHEDGDEVVAAEPVDLILLVDLSHSMSAADVSGPRIERARAAVEEIVEARVADRIALSLFADWSYGLVPLTEDTEIVDFFAPWMSPDLIASRDQGTSLTSMVGHAREVWDQRGREGAQALVLVLSDGEAHGADAAVLDSVDAIRGSGLRVWTAGVGSPGGAPLFVSRSEGSPLLDGDGEPVVARFEPTLLRAMAERGAGSYFDISDESGAQDLVAALRQVSGGSSEGLPVPPDPARWFLLAALILLLLESVLDSGFVSRAWRRLRAPAAAPGQGRRR